MVRPSRVEAASTGLVAALVAAALLSPGIGSALAGLGFVLLEVVGRVVDRPTWLVVAAYLLLAALAVSLELRQPLRSRVPMVLWALVSGLAVLGQLYVLALAWLLQPLVLAVLLLVAAGLWLVTARRGAGSAASEGVVPGGPLPVVSLFVAVHLLVEGAAGHIQTPWLHQVSAAFSRSCCARLSSRWASRCRPAPRIRAAATRRRSISTDCGSPTWTGCSYSIAA